MDGTDLVVKLSGWRRMLSTRAEVRFPLACITRVEHDPLARSHVRTGLRNWRRHGQGVWRLGIYHGIDGWSFWSIGIGRNAVLMECSGQRFRYVVVEVAEPRRTVREIRAGVVRVTGEIPPGIKASATTPSEQSLVDTGPAGHGVAEAGKIESMTSHRLDFEAHRAALGRECDLLVSMSAEDPGLAVPTCPEWALSDLFAHLSEVFSFWRTQLEAASLDAPADPATKSDVDLAELSERFEGACEALQAALAARDAEAPCWNWSGNELTVGWVARRMALESAVHRYDVELSIGAPSPITTELAVDGIDEWISVHLATDVPEAPDADLGGVLCLACTDDAAAWTVETAGGKLRWREGRGPADAVIVGTASDLYLYCWNRRPLDVLELTGSRDVALAWTSLAI
ncbi:MAG: maleylpyruvate isomerase family mycothiol-dependent enzyme [Acidimicrobiales bacterium]